MVQSAQMKARARRLASARRAEGEVPGGTLMGRFIGSSNCRYPRLRGKLQLPSGPCSRVNSYSCTRVVTGDNIISGLTDIIGKALGTSTG